MRFLSTAFPDPGLNPRKHRPYCYCPDPRSHHTCKSTGLAQKVGLTREVTRSRTVTRISWSHLRRTFIHNSEVCELNFLLLIIADRCKHLFSTHVAFQIIPTSRGQALQGFIVDTNVSGWQDPSALFHGVWSWTQMPTQRSKISTCLRLPRVEVDLWCV